MSIRVEIKGADKFIKSAVEMKKAREAMRAEVVRLSNLFGVNAKSTIQEKYLSGPRPQRLAPKSGELRSRVGFRVYQDGNRTLIRFGNPLVYARIHEYGGTTRPTVTKKMRSWAWRQFFETGDEMYKWIALTKKPKLTIKIPKRPYLAPGIREEMPAFQKNLELMLKRVTQKGIQNANNE